MSTTVDTEFRFVAHQMHPITAMMEEAVKAAASVKIDASRAAQLVQPLNLFGKDSAKR